MPGLISCQDCGWNGPDEEVEVHEEADHEVWEVFTCPACGYVISKIERARLESEFEPRRKV